MNFLAIYLLIVNLIAFVLYGVDKSRARREKWRIPEATLIGVAAAGGALGAFVGMKVWHHKTKKLKFTILVPLFLIVWLAGLFYLYSLHGHESTPADAAYEAATDTEIPATAQTDPEDKAPAAQQAPTESPKERKPEIAPKPIDITLAFIGDINFDDSWCVMQYYHSQGDNLSKVIDEEYLKIMRDADIFWVNNEFTYSDRGTPLNGKAYTFRSDPKNVNILKEMGVDIVGLANNHVYDYGPDAFTDTLDTLDSAGIPYVGAGRNLNEAKAPVYMECEGITVAYVAASRAEKLKMTPQATDDSPGILRCYDNTLFLESIKEADKNADYVIALPHWGTEYSTDLESAQTTGAREYIDAGADAVIGAHTHCLQKIDEYNGKPIVYSLGNFWFNEKTLETMLFEIHLTGEKKEDAVTIDDASIEIFPGMQKDLTTTLAKSDEEYQRIMDYINSL